MQGDNLAAHRLMAHLSGHLERRRSGYGQDELIVRLDSAA
jgi:hypothetical protein